ncbi:Protein Y32F6A.4 [Aphelenchoides avenae]|nr:Protein Y32F6A.4 [Aphelenchus avenae]
MPPNSNDRVNDSAKEKASAGWMVPPEGKAAFTPASGAVFGDGVFQNGRFTKHRGMHWFVAGLFVVGDMAGAGIVALPTALVQTQFYPGLIVMAIMTICATSSAVLLGRCWSILLKWWPEYRTHCRKPYAEIGLRAAGTTLRNIVSLCINVTQFGASVVLLLLASKNIRDFIDAQFEVYVSVCLVVVVVAIALLPLTFLKSPEDFWWVVMAGMASTAVAVVLLTIGAARDYGGCAPQRAMPGFHATNYFLAFGTVLFTYGGHSAFPTIQHDMRKPHEFTKSAILAFTVITIFYAPVAISGSFAYGNSLRHSMINSVQTSWIQQATNLMITAHCLLTIILIANPLNQEMEELFDTPHHFGWKRVAVRTGVMVAIVFVAESVPTFGPLLDLMGGSTVTLTSLIFPVIFYIYLRAGETRREEKGGDPFDLSPPTFSEMVQNTSRWTLIGCGFVIVFGLLGGGAASYAAVRELSSQQFEIPCYVRPFLSDGNAKNTASLSTNCCGTSQNITTFSDHCSPSDLYFYGEYAGGSSM